MIFMHQWNLFHSYGIYFTRYEIRELQFSQLWNLFHQVIYRNKFHISGTYMIQFSCEICSTRTYITGNNFWGNFFHRNLFWLTHVHMISFNHSTIGKPRVNPLFKRNRPKLRPLDLSKAFDCLPHGILQAPYPLRFTVKLSVK